MNLDTFSSPALVIDLDTVRHNIQAVLRLLGDNPTRWRPHLKTTKIPEIWSLLLDAGLTAFKVATVREARVFLELVASKNLDAIDFLVAYPLQGPAIHSLARLAHDHANTRVSLLSESPHHASSLPAHLGVFVDLNIGMDRTGIPAEDTPRILATTHAAGARFRGLHGYEGHISGNTPVSTRRRNVEHALKQLSAVVDVLEDAQVHIPEIITSGTPSFVPAFELSPFHDIHHTLSPGTVVLGDTRCLAQPELASLRPAAQVLTRVISHPRPHRITCDAGSKALAAEVGDPCVRVLGHPDWTARKPSEEHLPIDLPKEFPVPALGTPLHLIPKHVCPTVNLAENALLIEGTTVTCVPVAARAHDL